MSLLMLHHVLAEEEKALLSVLLIGGANFFPTQESLENAIQTNGEVDYLLEGGNVYFHSSNSVILSSNQYTPIYPFFYNNSSIEAIIDTLGIITFGGRKNTINRCSNLKYLYAPNMNISSSTGKEAYFNLSNLKAINIEGTAGFGYRNFRGASSLRVLNAKNATSVLTNGVTGFTGLNSLERLNIEKVNSIDETGNEPDMFSSIKSGCKIYHSVSLGAKDRTSFAKIRPISGKQGISVGTIITIGGLDYEAVSSGTTRLAGQFYGDVHYNTDFNNLRSAINADTRTPDYGTGFSVLAFEFNNMICVKSSGVIGSNANLLTISFSANSGLYAPYGSNFVGGEDVHMTLKILREEKGAVLIEKTDWTLPNKPTALSISNQTLTTLDLNFTPPTPNVNGIDSYEIWIDDDTEYRGFFEFCEISASGDTIDLSEVVNDVNGGGTISGCTLKIRTIDNQMNFSEFEEIIIP